MKAPLKLQKDNYVMDIKKVEKMHARLIYSLIIFCGNSFAINVQINSWIC